MKRASAGPSLATFLLLAALAASSSGCALFRAKSDSERVSSNAAAIEGTVSCPTADGEPLVTVLWNADKPDQGILRSWLAYSEGAYRFVVPAPGHYRLLAFLDRSGDLEWQPGEPAALYEGGKVVEVRPGERRQQIDLHVGGSSPDKLPIAVRLSKEKVLVLPTVTLHVGEVTTLKDPRFSDDTASLGLWEPSRFLKDPGIGLYLLEPYDPKKLPVLFVHGAAGSPTNFEALIGALDRSRFQPWVAHYPSGMRLPLTCQTLAQMVVRLQAERSFPALGVVAHSMGGLVARGLLNELSRSEAPLDVPFFVTLSTPWGGHSAAGLGVEYSPGVVPQWIDMTPGSDFLKHLWRTPLPAGTDHALLFGYRAKSSVMLERSNDGTLTLSSMLDPRAQAGARKLVAFDQDHMSILSAPEVLATVSGLLGAARAPGSAAAAGNK